MLSLKTWARAYSSHYQPRKEVSVMASDYTLPINEFNVTTFTYKKIQEQSILLDLLVPKSLPPGERPVII
jgi:hypothetical protein